MDDLISRQAVIDKLKREEKILYSPAGLRYLIGAVRDLASVDAVPKEKYDRLKENAEILSKACDEMEYVVRCRDCKYLDKGENESEAWSLCVYKSWQPVSVGDEHFCSWGERKDGEADD